MKTTATIIPISHWRRTHARARCDAISLAEGFAQQAVAGLGCLGMPPPLVRVASMNVRWGAAFLRDQARFWYGA